MRILMLCGACLVAVGASAPVAAKGKSATCDAPYYSYLVGKGVDEARTIEGSNYRLIAVGAARGELQARRMTITYDPASSLIVEVACG